MRVRLTAALILFVALSAGAAAAHDDLKVKLSNKRDWLYASVLNQSSVPVRVGKDFRYSIFDLSFEVRDMQGRNRDFSSKVNGGPSPLVDMLPGGRMRTRVSIDNLALDYELEAGLYDVTAVYPLYSPDFRVIETYRSNTVRIKVEGDDNWHWMRMKERGEIFEVDLSALKARQGGASRP